MQHRCSFDICGFRLFKLYNYLLIYDYFISCSTLEINVILPRNHVKFTENHTEKTLLYSRLHIMIIGPFIRNKITRVEKIDEHVSTARRKC